MLNNYSYFHPLQKRDLDKAEQMSGITVKLEPMNPTYLDTYGWVLFEQGAYVMAKIYTRRRSSIVKRSPRPKYMSITATCCTSRVTQKGQPGSG